MGRQNGLGSSNSAKGGNKHNRNKYHQAAERLRKSEEKYRIFFETAHDAFMVLKEDVFVDCNSRALEMFG